VVIESSIDKPVGVDFKKGALGESRLEEFDLFIESSIEKSVGVNSEKGTWRESCL
jgi:hypothetical protein